MLAEIAFSVDADFLMGDPLISIFYNLLFYISFFRKFDGIHQGLTLLVYSPSVTFIYEATGVCYN